MSNQENDIIEEIQKEMKEEPTIGQCKYHIKHWLGCPWCRGEKVMIKTAEKNKALRRLEESKMLFDVAFKRAVQAVKDAQEELTRPLTRDEILERDEENF